MDQALLTALRLLLAALLGGVIGYQRELKDRPAGFRTHIMVCVGSTLFMLVSAYDYGPGADPTRIGAGVVTGIGFLGAGSIIRQGNVVQGLTTAASLWSVAAVGLAVGVGYYTAALIGTLMIFLALTLFKTIESRLLNVRERRIMQVVGIDSAGFGSDIERQLTGLGLGVESIEVNREQDGILFLRLSLEFPSNVPFSHAFQKISSAKGVSAVRWEL